MVLLETANPSSGRPLTVAIFGAGLIGSAIVSRLEASASLRKEELPFNWTDSSIQLGQLQDVETRILTGLGPNTKQLLSCSKLGAAQRLLRIVWSAGSAGFGASHDETERELHVFRMVLDMAERLAVQYPGDPVSFYLMSSAGGLFEGQRHVDQNSRPTPPRRPYGLLKQCQEEFVMAAHHTIVKKIYRLTSVYGFIRTRHRRGLVPTMILNGARRQATHIIGGMDTLRDFIWVEDVAGFIARQLLDDSEASTESPYTLASGKPCSIHEIQKIVESTIGRKTYMTYSLDRSNSEDITFSNSLHPKGWFSSDLRLGSIRIYNDLVHSGILFNRV